MCLDNHSHMQCADGKCDDRIVHGVGESPEYEVWGSFWGDATKVCLSLDPGLFSM
ncbi:hypothetical protein BHYA_0177g00030 [Botrytis hyacinthi]|uniref:Uncharacterized protein n=1 Tax=Botrytis hyacinthi TaxID=278943 RepID=A0A4Z1GHP3_9HELO|nr:hypothetical protein BHYA_0177g00030 [Botrytis hyacinthi]